ncbi:hypothetical protein KUCAC02_026661 [Chaenocephalus aceratus]|nr:hypothetical protein KUCAC02_026661 [Chaenocephalus aceratus]
MEPSNHSAVFFTAVSESNYSYNSSSRPSSPAAVFPTVSRDVRFGENTERRSSLEKTRELRRVRPWLVLAEGRSPAFHFIEFSAASS